VSEKKEPGVSKGEGKELRRGIREGPDRSHEGTVGEEKRSSSSSQKKGKKRGWQKKDPNIQKFMNEDRREAPRKRPIYSFLIGRGGFA